MKDRLREGLNKTRTYYLENKKYTYPATAIAALLILIVSIAIFWGDAPDSHPENGAGQPVSSNLAPGAGFEGVPPILTMSLFFLEPSGRTLVSEERDITVDPAEQNVAQTAKMLVNELLQGSKQGNIRTIPSGTIIRHCYWDNQGTLYLDFNSIFLTDHTVGSSSEWFMINSILKTIERNIPTVKHVQFIFDGQPIDQIMINGTPAVDLFGHLDLRQPFPLSTES